MMPRNFSTYFFALKKVWELHTKLGFGETPNIPSGFSERLCRHLFKLPNPTNRVFDAGNNTEIKATGSVYGRSTISNSANFSVLYWLYFDFANDSVQIYKLPIDCFRLKGGKGRSSIRLAKIVKDHNITPQIIKF